MMRYFVVLEKGSFGAYVPDLPGCIAAGKTREEILSFIREGIELHLQGLKENGEAISQRTSTGEFVEAET